MHIIDRLVCPSSLGCMFPLGRVGAPSDAGSGICLSSNAQATRQAGLEKTPGHTEL
jgi:hypothetical protein